MRHHEQSEDDQRDLLDLEQRILNIRQDMIGADSSTKESLKQQIDDIKQQIQNVKDSQ